MPAIQAAITSLQAAFDAALSAALSAKDGEIATLRETLSAERGRADRAVVAMAGLNEHLADSGPSLPTLRPSSWARRSPRARRRPTRPRCDRPKPSGGDVASWRD